MAAASVRIFNAIKQKRALYYGSTKLFGLSNSNATAAQHVRHFAANPTKPIAFARPLVAFYSTSATPEENVNSTTGSRDKHEFKAETRMLLDIVARSLYSENEVFVRELISNASDALEKFRYTIHTAGDKQNDYVEIDRPLEIHLETNKQASTLTIRDTGIGMTKEELVNNLGTIARSGSKQFLEELKNSGTSTENSSNIIGQFGVGFYSAFMVANKVEVLTRSSKVGSVGLRWSSDGAGSYEIEEVDNVEVGTTIVIHLKHECREYADEERISSVIKKYSNFVGSPIYLNKQKVNEIQALWLSDPKQVTKEEYDEFYRYISNSYLKPRFTLHYKTDAPLSIRALLYIPEAKPGLMDFSQQTDAGVALYTRKILIQSKAEKLLPKWLRFVKGVVDSEDIPLNLSRELLQNSALIQKLQNVLTNRILRHLQDRAAKQPSEYGEFYDDYKIFLKEGIIVTENQNDKEEIAKLLRFNTNRATNSTEKISFADYVNRMPADQKDIYYLAAPNRELAENSPYFEGLKAKNFEVLFCYDPYDELVLMQLQKFLGKNIVSVEKEMRADTNADNLSELGADSLQRSQINELVVWIKGQLAGKVSEVKATTRLVEHPCVVTVEDMAAARHFIRTQGHQIPEENRYALLQPQLEINPKHPIVKKLFELKTSNPELSVLLINQLFGNAMVGARLIDDAQSLLKSINELLAKALEKH